MGNTMAVRDIVLYAENETVLRKKSEPVRGVNRCIKDLVKDLYVSALCFTMTPDLASVY
jgi:hypothetical protein